MPGCVIDQVTGCGSNQPTVRFDGASIAARRGGDLLERDRGDARGSVGEHVDAGDGLEVAELVRDVGDAVVVEDQPRAAAAPSPSSAPRR